MDLSVVLSAYTILFLAEMGDKTQVMAMTLAHRYRVMPVVAGVFLAFLCLNLLAVWIGDALYHYVPQRLTLLTAGGLFLYFAYRSWQDATNTDADGPMEKSGGHGALVSSFSLIFLAELGDKSQLVIIALAAGTGEPWSVLIGGTLALWSVSLIAILLGGTLLRRIPKSWMHRVAAVLFLGFGAIAVTQALTIAEH